MKEKKYYNKVGKMVSDCCLADITKFKECADEEDESFKMFTISYYCKACGKKCNTKFLKFVE